jgi:molybdenum cofactor synthesis domain-containing protein
LAGASVKAGKPRNPQEGSEFMEEVSAAILVIGDEILSGRTADVNINHIARVLAEIGIDLREARVVPDIEVEIVAAVNALRARYTYVFTTGGIGPTHDDITSAAIAKAFGLPLEENAEALAALQARYGPTTTLNEARRRMAHIPKGAQLVRNNVSGAPGFQIGNVFVLAGVPGIMRAMLEDIVPHLKTGTPVVSRTIAIALGESTMAAPLGDIQRRHPDVAIGSYPAFGQGGPKCSLVVRGRDPDKVEAAAHEIETMLRGLGAEPKRIS